MKISVLIIALLLMSCTGNIQNTELETKAVYGADIVLQNESTYAQFKPIRVFFKKIENPDNLKDGVIISSDKTDKNGNIGIITEPGTYAVIAAERNDNKKRIVVIFDENIISKTRVDLKAGDTQTTEKLFIMEYNGNILGTPSSIQEYNRDSISKGKDFTVYNYKPGVLNPLKYKYEKTQNDLDIENQVEIRMK